MRGRAFSKCEIFVYSEVNTKSTLHLCSHLLTVSRLYPTVEVCGVKRRHENTRQGGQVVGLKMVALRTGTISLAEQHEFALKFLSSSTFEQTTRSDPAGTAVGSNTGHGNLRQSCSVVKGCREQKYERSKYSLMGTPQIEMTFKVDANGISNVNLRTKELAKQKRSLSPTTGSDLARKKSSLYA
uniref:Uncharacterized protein n=1 Tax=Tanacetum cinerariifolium TaxID=118510 RepID=A0A699ILG6_TANCI|nr:hypothetical protein [Tanacetum cinerariifolium]